MLMENKQQQRERKKKKKKKKIPNLWPDPRPGKPTRFQTRFFGSGRVSDRQTRFLSGRVSGHSKPDPNQPNISPRLDK